MSTSFSMKNSTTSNKLQVENRQMEERLQALKSMMSAEKARRELDGGIHWQCGKPGPLQVTSKNTSALSLSNGQASTKKRPLEKRPIKVRILSDENSKSANLVQCGQCEKTSASLSCVECIENYCQLCFAKMHHRGALAKHHVKPIMRNVKSFSPKKSSTGKPVTVPPPPPSKDEVKSHLEPKPESLLEGIYDEATSAKSFQEALTEWRNGGDLVSFKECSTISNKDISTGTRSTITGGIQVGVSSFDNTKPVNVEFSDKNRPKVTYFEKLMLRKLKDSTTNNEATKPPVLENSSPEPESRPTISEYNIFYDDEDGIPDFREGDLHDDHDGCDDDFREWRAPSPITINEVLSPSDEKLTLSEHGALNTPNSYDNEKESISNTEDLALRSVESETPSETKAECDKERIELTSEENRVPPSCEETHAHQLNEVDISSSVKSAWSFCKQEAHSSKQLAHFFLHGVAESPEDGTDLNSTEPADQDLELAISPSQFKLGTTIWLPSSSRAQDEPDISCKGREDEKYSSESSNLRLGNKDHYNDETDSDSDDENEREAFISSRLSMVHDSIESMEPSRPATSCRDLEREEELERDQDDQNALEELAWELASTVECEGRLTRCESELDQLEGDCDQGEPSECDLEPVGSGRDLNERGEVGELDMSKVMSEFEIYQKELMEEESND